MPWIDNHRHYAVLQGSECSIQSRDQCPSKRGLVSCPCSTDIHRFISCTDPYRKHKYIHKDVWDVCIMFHFVLWWYSFEIKLRRGTDTVKSIPRAHRTLLKLTVCCDMWLSLPAYDILMYWLWEMPYLFDCLGAIIRCLFVNNNLRYLVSRCYSISSMWWLVSSFWYCHQMSSLYQLIILLLEKIWVLIQYVNL